MENIDIKDGLIAQYSKQAVNGGQLYELQQLVNQNTIDIAKNTAAITANRVAIEKIIAAMSANKIAMEKNMDANAAALAALHTMEAQNEAPRYVNEKESYNETIARLDKSISAEGNGYVRTESRSFLTQISALSFRLDESEVRLESLEKQVQELVEVLAK